MIGVIPQVRWFFASPKSENQWMLMIFPQVLFDVVDVDTFIIQVGDVVCERS